MIQDNGVKKFGEAKQRRLPLYWRFFREFCREKGTVGAVLPSSPSLARRIVSPEDMREASVGVEYGPGPGSFTKEIISHLGEQSCFIAIEKNREMADQFQRRYPQVRLFHDSVERVEGILSEVGESQVDHIISGLPWASFSSELQDRFLGPTLSVLREGGTFSTFTYIQSPLLRSGKRFRRKLEKHFCRVVCSKMVWWNFPPAFVYRCTK